MLLPVGRPRELRKIRLGAVPTSRAEGDISAWRPYRLEDAMLVVTSRHCESSWDGAVEILMRLGAIPDTGYARSPRRTRDRVPLPSA